MIKKYNFIATFLVVLLVISIAVTAAQEVSIKKLSKTNRDGYVKGNVLINDYESSLSQINLEFTYIGKKSSTSRFASTLPLDKFTCNYQLDGSYTCFRYVNNKVGEDVTSQFKIEMETKSLATTSDCVSITSDSVNCDKLSQHYLKLNWETPANLYNGFYKVRVEAVDTSGDVASDESKFRNIKRKPTLTSNTESTPSTSSQKPTDTENSGSDNGEKRDNRNTVPIEPITLQELVQCQKIFVQIIRGMHNPNIDTSDLDLTIVDLNHDGIISLSDLVIFQQHYRNPGWCRAFFEPKLETSG